ncbi:MAG: amidohydrolase family protein [Candidatus Heimdallarchaeota archaeon]|nr:amidohydrolase family protein [Candidatus Heimdallarchaeota archaeon]
MILVTEKNNGKLRKLNVVDTHTHTGKEEVVDGRGTDHRIIRPKDHLNLYEKLKYALHKRILENPEDYAYLPLEDAEEFAKPTTQLQELIFTKKRTRQNIGWFADKIVTFPLHDILLAKTDPHFRLSNNYILSRAQSFEYGSRLIPFCRLDPTNEAEKAQKELYRCIELGARGLKLHPMSEKWLDDIITPEVIEIVSIAAENKLPVLFDCQNYQTAQDIHQVAMEVRDQVKKTNKNFTVIIGHFGFDYQTPGMFEILADPNIKTETSGMRGADCEIFYQNCLNLTEDWQLYTMYGTDHDYFSVPQATDHLSFLLSERAKDIGITFEDIRHVLGINALRMLKLYWPEKILDREGINSSKVKWEDFDKILDCKNYKQLAKVVADLSSISGVFFNNDSLFNPSGDNIYEELFILNLFADVIDVRRSFVIQQDGDNLKISEITKLMDFAAKVSSILEETDDSYPFTKEYLFDYLMRQTT